MATFGSKPRTSEQQQQQQQSPQEEEQEQEQEQEQQQQLQQTEEIGTIDLGDLISALGDFGYKLDALGRVTPVWSDDARLSRAYVEEMEVEEGVVTPRAILVLANDSLYTVSYSVIQDGIRTREKDEHTPRNTSSGSGQNRTVFGNSAAPRWHRNTAVGKLLAKFKREEAEDMARMEDDAGTVLLRDFRMEGTSDAIEIPFPADCEELRVRAYFWNSVGGDKWWQEFKTGVYSIAGKADGEQKTVFTVRPPTSRMRLAAGTDAGITTDHDSDDTERTDSPSRSRTDRWSSNYPSWYEQDTYPGYTDEYDDYEVY